MSRARDKEHQKPSAEAIRAAEAIAEEARQMNLMVDVGKVAAIIDREMAQGEVSLPNTEAWKKLVELAYQTEDGARLINEITMSYTHMVLRENTLEAQIAELREALTAVLHFYHNSGFWGAQEQARWRDLTGKEECTTKSLCDHVRAVLVETAPKEGK